MSDPIRSRNRRHLMGQTFSDQEVIGDYRNGLLYKSAFTNIIFRGANFGKAGFTGASFVSCIFENCSMAMTNFAGCSIQDGLFQKCDLDQAVFEGAILKNVAFDGGRAQYSSFLNASLFTVVFDIDLHGSDLRFGYAKDVDFRESNLWGISIPVSCRMFRGKTLSKRQLELFLALLSETKGNDDLRKSIKDLAGENAVTMMRLLAGRDEE